MTKWCPVPNNRIPKVQSQWRPGQLGRPFLPILESIPPERDQTHPLPYPLSHIFLLCCSSSSMVCPLLGKSRTPHTSLCQPLWCFMSFSSTLEAFKESCKWFRGTHLCYEWVTKKTYVLHRENRKVLFNSGSLLVKEAYVKNCRNFIEKSMLTRCPTITVRKKGRLPRNIFWHCKLKPLARLLSSLFPCVTGLA